jgi:hypothetical protein
MKYLSLLMLLPLVALAQPPAPQMDSKLFFEEAKKMMQPMVQETLPAMRQTRACMENADDQAAFEKCAEIMIEVEKKMRAQAAPGAHMPQGRGSMAPDPKDVKWNETTKARTLKSLDRSIAMGDAMNECLNQSASMEQYQQCVEAKKSKP